MARSSGVDLPLNLPYNTVPFTAATQIAQINTQAFTQSLRAFPSIGGFSAISMSGHSSYNGIACATGIIDVELVLTKVEAELDQVSAPDLGG